MSSESGIDDISSSLIPPVEKTDDDDDDSEQESEKIVIDEMLTRYCGEFGLWQIKHFVLTCSAWALEAFHTMVMIFADREPSWRCLDSSGSGCLLGSNSQSGSVCDLVPGSWEWIGGSSASTISEWGLLCGDKYKVGLAQSGFFAGCMVGAGIFGHLSDSFLGRKGSLTTVCVLNAIFGCLTALSPTYWFYAVLRFLTGLSTGGVGLCCFVLATEPIGPSARGAVGMSTFYFFSGGIVMLSGIAYLFQSWRSLYIASTMPSIIYLVAFLPFISESPRWYLVRGKVDQAMKVMHNIAKGNGKKIPTGVILALDDECNDKNSNEGYSSRAELMLTASASELIQGPMTRSFQTKDGTKDAAARGSLIDVIKSPVTRIRLLLTIAINLVTCIVYYGLSLNVVNLKTNLYISVLINAVAEMPAFAITAILLDRFGRKPLAIGTMWFSGIFCLIGSMVSNSGAGKVLRMFCGVLGIFGMAGTYNLLFIYTAELFPTVVRNAALGCATQAAQMGAILAPLVVVMGGGLPFAVFAACGIIGGLFAFYLPETLNRPLYDTMAGIEEGEARIVRDSA
ncbi:Solute carrier family 22 member [Thalictrum thalictroides]|uniref:Solute carrier family 22 member n=1 Tax=Thalictrum thalictroides TaxID=46969 RepID=A0A7J6VAV2_THATH|nr:Solute carrier family 22 member [Thalictrum thalictroides]